MVKNVPVMQETQVPWGKIPWRKERIPTPVRILENSMDGGTWWAIVHGLAKSGTRLSDFMFTLIFR